MTRKEKALLILSSVQTSEVTIASAYAEMSAENKAVTEQELLVKLWGDAQMLATQLTYFISEQKLNEKFEAWLENEESL